MAHCHVENILIDKRRHPFVTDIRSYRGAG